MQSKLEKTQDLYDVLVIGAGIQGVGVAQACAERGLTTCIVEKAPKAAMGTSSKSSKLIHGGLRYLETAQFSLVYQCLRARAELCRTRPELVQLKTFYLPIYTSSKRHPLWVGLGLFAYWILAGAGPSVGFSRLSAKSIDALPIKKQGLRAVFTYKDAQTDDAALTRAVLKSAQSLGVNCEFSRQVNRIEWCQDHYRVVTSNGVFLARAIANCAGPWVNQVAQCMRFSVKQLPIAWVQGSHLLLECDVPNGYYYLESPEDARPIFVLPWQGKLLLGTTETPFNGDPDTLVCTEQEQAYLLVAFNHYFPNHSITAANIVKRITGLRVLPDDTSITENTNNPVNANKKPRDTRIVVDQQQGTYVAVYGGKLTAYRATALKVVNKLI